MLVTESLLCSLFGIGCVYATLMMANSDPSRVVYIFMMMA